MKFSQLKSCPSCGVSLTAPKEKTNAEGKKTKVGNGQEPKIQVVLDPDDDPDTGFVGDDILGWSFTCARCGYLWFEPKE